MNAIAGLEGDDLTEEIRAESETLQTEYADLETRNRAAIVAADDDDPQRRAAEFGEDGESAEVRSLLIGPRRASVATIFASALEHRNTDGPEAEIQAHFKIGPNQIPLAMLRTEQRAVTAAPADVGTMQEVIIPGVFPYSCAAFLGVDMPTVGVGEAVYPVLTTNASVEALAEAGSGTETDGSFSAEVLSPSRLQASFRYSREDRARFMGMDQALRQNLSMALSDALDKQILSGADGLLTGANLANNNVAAITTFALYLSGLAYGRVDGIYAAMTKDLRIVMGSAAYAHAGSVYRNNTVDRTVLDRLMEITGGVKVSAHVPALSGANKQNVVIARGMGLRHCVAPIWEGVALIPDEVTKAASGEIVVTAVMLHAVQILRAAGFHKQQVQTA